MSTQNGMNCGKLVGLHDGTVLVKTYDWESYLASYLKNDNRNQQTLSLKLDQI